MKTILTKVFFLIAINLSYAQQVLNVPNDPLFYLQWGHRNLGNVTSFNNQGNINSPGMDSKILEAWNITTGSPNIIVAIIDSGLDTTHPDIDQSRIVNSWNFITNSSNVYDYNGHGTITTGIIAAKVNNGIGIAGVDQFCRIMPLVVDPTNFTQVANAIKRAVTNGAKVINMSFGGVGGGLETSFEIKEAINFATRNNVTLVASAGNDNRNTVDYPSRFSEVISVGSANPCGLRKVAVLASNPGNCDKDYRGETASDPAWGSNYDEGLDVLAPGSLLPGVDMLGINGFSHTQGQISSLYSSTSDGNYLTNILGTSFAAPFVTGVVSLMLAVNPNLKPYQIQQIIRTSIVAGSENMINAFAAIQIAQNYSNNYLLGDWDLVTSASSNVYRENLIGYSINVKNIGQQYLPQAQLSYKLLREDNTIAYQNFVNIPSLAPGSKKAFSFNLQTSINNCGQDLTVKLVAEVIANGQQEASTLNNVTQNIIKILKRNDLSISSHSVLGNTQINFVVKNNGPDLALSGFSYFKRYVQLFGSNDDALDSSDVLIGANSNVNYSEFRICGNATKEYSLNVESGNNINNYNYVIIQFDFQNHLIETNEGNNNYAIRTSRPGPQTVPIHYYYQTDGGGANFYTRTYYSYLPGLTYSGVAFNAYETPVNGAIPVHRYYHPEYVTHFYSINYSDIGDGSGLGFVYEGEEFYAYNYQYPGTVPVYRYFNPSLINHYYTTNFYELGYGNYGWDYEGEVFYAFPSNFAGRFAQQGNLSTSEIPLEKSLLKAYPNPTSAIFILENESTPIESVIVTDFSGKVVIEKTINGKKSELDLSNFSKGLYFAKVKVGETIKVVKIFKE